MRLALTLAAIWLVYSYGLAYLVASTVGQFDAMLFDRLAAVLQHVQ